MEKFLVLFDQSVEIVRRDYLSFGPLCQQEWKNTSMAVSEKDRLAALMDPNYMENNHHMQDSGDGARVLPYGRN